MCHEIFLSTTSPQDLAELPDTLFKFQVIEHEADPGNLDLLAYPQTWLLLGEHGGCSCAFRHDMSGKDAYFSAPEDWFPEDRDDIQATLGVYDLVATILSEGHKVDLVDIWNGDEPESIQSLDVSLSAVGRDAFRFFEKYKFNLTK